MSAPAPRSLIQNADAPSFWDDIRTLLGPARRRTDHPLVVGVIVICLGIMALASIIQVTATIWAGSQVRILMDSQRGRDADVEKMRDWLFKNTQAQGYVLRRLCLNTSKGQNEEAQKECLSVGPPPPPLEPKGGSN